MESGFLHIFRTRPLFFYKNPVPERSFLQNFRTERGFLHIFRTRPLLFLQKFRTERGFLHIFRTRPFFFYKNSVPKSDFYIFSVLRVRQFEVQF